jgi:DUF1680 family protein
MRHLGIALLCAAPLAAGDMTARFDRTLDRLLKGGPPYFSTGFVLADAVPQHTRRFTEFSGDVSGRYIGAVAMAAQLQGREIPELDRAVTGLLALQKPDGHFGGPLSEGGKVTNQDMAIMWGNGRLLIGLMEYYRVKPRADVLAVARKIGGFMVNVSPLYNSEAVRREYNGEKFAVGYICWTQHIEGLVALWQATKEDRYLALAKELAARTDRHPSQHSHGFLSTVRGIVDLYHATGDKRYLDQAAREWQGVVDSGNVLLQGAVPEMFAPAIKRDEGCSEADWLRLSLVLWRATGEQKYLQQAERTLFNEFSMNQFASGDFGHHTLSIDGVGGPYARAWWCCTLHGLRALAAVLTQVFHEKDGTLYYDLPADGQGQSGAFAVRAESSLERDGSVTFTVTATDGKPHTIVVRQPEWASAVSAREFTRTWKKGETVTVRYQMVTRTLRTQKGTPKVAVFHGPWLLGVDVAASPTYFDEPSPQNRVIVPVGERIALEHVTGAPLTHFKLKYLPGGYPMQPQEAVLRPVAEYSSGPEANRIEWWLPVKPEAERLDSNYTKP